MRKVETKGMNGLVRLLRASLLLVFQFPLLATYAQESVPLCSDWLATVDETMQRIVLRWRPSTDSAVMGYHICTGTPCIDYDTVFGRLDTTYICLDHSPQERHTYRLHVFDSAYNVSELTPSFGNMVLTADVPDCEATVIASWTPYEGMPGGLGGYRLMAMLEPLDSVYEVVARMGADGPLTFTLDLPDEVTNLHLKVLAYNADGTLVSQSNIVSAERRTARTACCNSITAISFDSINNAIRLKLMVDTAFRHTLWRSIDGTPWQVIDTIRSETFETEYTDTHINRYDSVHCYQLSVSDECGLNERYSATAWTVVPDPPSAAIAIPNIIIVGSENNAAFRPETSGLMGDIYELYIYNRNGTLVFHTDDPTAAWQPDNSMPQGAYAYHLRLRFNDNKIHTYIGTVIIVK